MCLARPAILVGAGDIATSGAGAGTTAALLDHVIGVNMGTPLTIFTTGDNAYSDGTIQQFLEYYEPTWGSNGKKDLTSPTPGNHDYHDPGAGGYFEYFGDAARGPLGEPYYGYDLGAWHAIALNSEIGVSAGDPQVLWLEADLQSAADHLCTVAYWHQPLYSSGQTHGDDPSYQGLWEKLHTFGVDLVLAGHDHLYERFGPQDPYGVADPAYGIRQFTVGTGGAGLYDFGTPSPNSEHRYKGSHGVLQLTLLDTGYEWAFIAVDGTEAGRIEDSGTAFCHGPPGGLPAPTAAFSWSCEELDCALTDLSSVQDVTSRTWDFGDDNVDAAGPVTVNHPYAQAGTYEVTLTVTGDGGEYSTSRSVTARVITLNAEWITGGGGRDKVELTWAGASGRSVDAYRDGGLLKTTRNRGKLSDNASLTTHVYQICEEGTATCSEEATAVYPTAGNESPRSAFSFSCTDLTCDFLDESTDDGTIVEWSWDFGDENASSSPSVEHTYSAEGVYTVTLTVTDDQGVTDSASQPVAVPPPPPGSDITLTASGNKEKGLRSVSLSWSGAEGSQVLVLRNGSTIDVTENDGSYDDVLGRGGGETLTYEVCEIGGACSDPVTVTF